MLLCADDALLNLSNASPEKKEQVFVTTLNPYICAHVCAPTLSREHDYHTQVARKKP